MPLLLLLFLRRNREDRVDDDDDDDGQQGRLGLPCEHGVFGAILEAGAKKKERHLLVWRRGRRWQRLCC